VDITVLDHQIAMIVVSAITKTKRAVGKNVEEYVWMVSVAHVAESTKVMLGNGNMTDSG
jgi:hypothetical protein